MMTKNYIRIPKGIGSLRFLATTKGLFYCVTPGSYGPGPLHSTIGKRDPGHQQGLILRREIGNFPVFAVADGLAGHPAGRIASDIAISSLIRAVHIKMGSPRTILENAVHDADMQIRQAIRPDS